MTTGSDLPFLPLSFALSFCLGASDVAGTGAGSVAIAVGAEDDCEADELESETELEAEDELEVGAGSSLASPRFTKDRLKESKACLLQNRTTAAASGEISERGLSCL